jgi:hypothetical protein
MTMNSNHLLEDEVEYELFVRNVGWNDKDDLNNKRRLLRNCLRNESENPTTCTMVAEVNPEADYGIVLEKIKEISAVLEVQGSKAKDYGTFGSRLTHLTLRLNRIRPIMNNQSRLFEITTSLKAIENLQWLYFPKQKPTRISTEDDAEKNDSTQDTGAIRKTSNNKETVSSEFTVIQEQGANELEDSVRNLKLSSDGQPTLPVQVLSKLSRKDKEEYLRAMQTVQLFHATLGQENFSANLNDEQGAVGGVKDFETSNDLNAITKKITNLGTTRQKVNVGKTSAKLSPILNISGNSNELFKVEPEKNRNRLSGLYDHWTSKSCTNKREKGVRWRSNSPNFSNENRGNSPHKRSSDNGSSDDNDNGRIQSSRFGGSSLRFNTRGHSFSSDSDNSSENSIPETAARNQSSRRSRGDVDSRQLPVSRWGVKFSADDSLSLVDFLRQVTMFANSEQMSEAQLLQKAGHLFKGTALEWYMSATTSYQFRKWKDLVKRLKEAFLPEYNDSYLLQECERRVQSKTETFEIYLAKMNRLFDGLSYELPEKTKLSILKQNLKPSHKIGVAMLDIRSVEQLRKYCRRLDGLDPSLYMRTQANTLNRPSFNPRPQLCELEPVEQTPKKKGRNRKKTSAEDNLVFTTRGLCAIENRSQQQQQPQPQNPRQNYTHQQNYRHSTANQNNFRPRNGDNQRQFYNRGQNREPAWSHGNPNRIRNDQPTGQYTTNRSYDGDNRNEPFVNQQAQNQTNFGQNTNPFLDNWAAEITGQRPTQQQQISQQRPLQQQPPFLRQQPIQVQQIAQSQTTAPFQQPIAQRQSLTSQPRSNSSSGSQLCWNCDGLNHNQRDCMAPRRVFCFQCGRRDVYVNTCPTCSGNANQQADQGARLSW